MGYLVKSAGGEELLDALEAVHRGRKYMPPSLAMMLAKRSSVDPLTERELEVLGLLARGQSNREIASELSIAENTVRIHVAHILQKLAVEDRTQAVILAFQRGIVHLE